MNPSQYVQMNAEEYAYVARALIVYDHIRARNAERTNGRHKECSELQERWLGEIERDTIIDSAYNEIDTFLEGETWHELAWWIAERECKRLAGKSNNVEARDLVTDQLYHQVMEEFMSHGIENLSVRDIPGDALSPDRVAHALERLRLQTKKLSERLKPTKA